MQVIALLAQFLNKHYSRKQIIDVITFSGTTVQEPWDPLEPYNDLDMATLWLKEISRKEPESALAYIGKMLEDFFEGNPYRGEGLNEDRERMRDVLRENGLRYIKGGSIVSTLAAGATKNLEAQLKGKDFPAVLDEFDRATKNVENRPRDAVSAAANILEAICKEYIDQHPHLKMPSSQDLSSVFDVVRKDLRFDPSAVQDNDLKQILSGLFAIISGTAALRTHGSSAHAQATSKRRYRLSPRHARLAVDAAHTVVAFILGTWEERESRKV